MSLHYLALDYELKLYHEHVLLTSQADKEEREKNKNGYKETLPYLFNVLSIVYKNSINYYYYTGLKKVSKNIIQTTRPP